jgi:hypothetical protein
MRKPLRSQRASALPAALVIVAVAAIVSASLSTLARTEILLARNRESAAAALAAADGCAAEVVSGLPAGWRFDALVLGPDGMAGTADDGARPAPAGCAAVVSAAPGPLDPARAVLRIEATAGGGRRTVDTVVGRSPEAGVPALLWLSDTAGLDDVHGSLTLSGADAARPASPLAALAAPADPAALDAWLAGRGPSIVVPPPARSPLRVPPPPLTELATRARAAGAAPGGTLVTTGTPPLALTLVTGDLHVASLGRGRGLLFVDGLLDITGTFEFSGVVVASAGIRVASAARLDVAGAVWLGGGATLAIDGEARVAADRAAVEAADGLLPLPRRAIPTSMRDAS